MTPKQEAALRLAREALENTSPLGFNMESDKRFYAAITAIREALAEQPAIKQDLTPEQPAQQQEPVAWFRYESVYEYKNQLARCTPKCIGAFPVYTSPPRKPWVGLTQQDIDIAFDDTQEGGGFD